MHRSLRALLLAAIVVASISLIRDADGVVVDIAGPQPVALTPLDCVRNEPFARVGTAQTRGQRVQVCDWSLSCQVGTTAYFAHARCLTNSEGLCPAWRDCMTANYAEDVQRAIANVSDTTLSPLAANERQTPNSASPYPSGFDQ